MNDRIYPKGAAKHVDVLILTALQDELDAVLAVATGKAAWTSHRDSEDFRYFTREVANARGERFVVAAAWIGEKGERTAAIRGKQLLDDLEPSCLAMCGICAGYRKEVALGDIIVADQIWAADEGKHVAEKDKPTVFYHSPHMFNMRAQWAMDAAYLAHEFDLRTLQAQRPPSKEVQRRWLLHTLYAHANAGGPAPAAHPDRARVCPGWADVVRQAMDEKLVVRQGASLLLTDTGRDSVDEDFVYHPGGPPPDPDLRVHVGAIATVSAVIKDAEIFERLRVVVRNTMGLEMEGTAIGDLAARFKKQSILVKAVQDYADSSKDDAFRAFGCRAAAEFLLAFLEKHFVPEQPHRVSQIDSNTAKNDQSKAAAEQSKIKRDQLYNELCKLSSPELGTLIFKLSIPTEMLPGENVARAERVIKVLEWAEPRGRVAELERLYREILGIKDPQ